LILTTQLLLLRDRRLGFLLIGTCVSVSIEPAAGRLVVRNHGGAIRLEPGEHIVLRKRLT